ncbi:MAG TPA: YceI family protein [Gammaproteobacteria bacterium]|nr:YceI family protein [Gammaproteobacteria bacterium]
MRLQALLLVLFAPVAAGQTSQWTAVPAQSQLTFVATYEQQPATGLFHDFQVRLRFDPAQPENGALDVTVDVTSADMHSSDINDAIRAPEWFGAAEHPTARFSSTAITKTGPQRFVAHGNLKLKGTVSNIDVPFRWEADGAQATMTGSLTLPRADFAIGTGQWSTGHPIGLDIKVSFRVRLHRVGAR